MGIMTDPSESRNRSALRKFLIKFKPLLLGLLYILGIVYFCSLASYNNATYFSENALLPGLVYSEIRSDTTNLALDLIGEIEREREIHKSSMPTAWIQAKFNQIGLETHSHNFTLNYPLGGGRTFSGKNIYGILRAPRIGSTESIVISTPYRAPDSIHPSVTHSLPILIAFANFARKQKYWAKDIIFLVTDQEQLGMQAWLEAYHGANVHIESQVLNCGSLDARAGSIQAAINLELQSFDIDHIDVKIEGLNGQLPNLDLVNLIQRLALKEGIVSGHKQISSWKRSGAKSSWEDNFKHMISMVLTQATGVPNGNHGLFYRYGIEAVTLEAHRREQTNHQRQSQGALATLKLVEGIARSLNNLLERFHQSFFFYLLVASDRFVSIGDYMPSLGLMTAALFIKAFIIWLKINQKTNQIITDESAPNNSDQPTEIENDGENDLDFISIGKFLITVHIFGVLAAYLPFVTQLDSVFHVYGVKTEVYLFAILSLLSILSLATPLFFSFNALNIEILHIAVLLETATALTIIGMLNFSLGLLLSVFIVPFATLLSPDRRGLFKWVSQLICFIFNPIVVQYLIVFAFTWHSFEGLSLMAIAYRALFASMDALTFSIVDSIIYGNWLYPLVALIFFPIWITFSSLPRIRPRAPKLKVD